MPELTRLERTKSIMRYLPPNGTAGLARSRVRGWRRVPRPPSITSPHVLLCAAKPQSSLCGRPPQHKPAKYKCLAVSAEGGSSEVSTQLYPQVKLPVCSRPAVI